MRNIKYLVILLFMVVSFSYGLFIGIYKVFPYEQVRSIRRFVSQSTSINFPTIKNPRTTLFEYFSPKCEIVMIGDSITQGGIWSEIFPNITIANRGVEGDTTEDILRRMDTIYDVKPRKAFVMVGINDFYRDFTVDEAFVNYKKIVSNLNDAGIEVFIQSTLECSKFKCFDKLQKVRSLNKNLSEYATQKNITYIDINKDLTSVSDGLLGRYTQDGIHLTGEGYFVWEKNLHKYIY